MKIYIYNNLNKDICADPNENYNLLEEIITDTMNKSTPTVIQKLNKHKHKNTVDYSRHYKVNKIQR